MSIRKKYSILLFILIMSVLLVGCTAENQTPIENNQNSTNNNENTQLTLDDPNLELLAYQLETEVRSSFQTAYESWKNLNKITEKNEDNLAQIISVLRTNLSNISNEEEIDKQINKLKQIDKGGEGEITFPTHEVVEKSEMKEQNDNTAKIEFNTTRYYPKTEWGGKSYNKDLNYIVTLSKNNGHWIIKKINYKSDK